MVPKRCPCLWLFHVAGLLRGSCTGYGVGKVGTVGLRYVILAGRDYGQKELGLTGILEPSTTTATTMEG